MNSLYNTLTTYGSYYPTKHSISDPNAFVKWTEKNFDYVKYNPRKDINRHGLSITSLDGGLSGIPDLDSIPEYNKEHGLKLNEPDFNVPTPVYDYPDLKKMLDPIAQHVCRSHVLRLDSGGYFPAHRDFRRNMFSSFRLLMPLRNVNAPKFAFILEDKIIQWQPGVLYFVDTAKMHYLFNASADSSYMIVINASLNEETVNFVTTNLMYL